MTPVSSATLALPVRPRRRRGGLAEKIAPYSYIAPFFVLFLAFGLGPLIYTGWVSLHHWEPLQIEHEFVGLQNYRVMLEDPRFWQAVRNTFAIFALSTIPGLVLALILASLLRKPPPANEDILADDAARAEHHPAGDRESGVRVGLRP